MSFLSKFRTSKKAPEVVAENPPAPVSTVDGLRGRYAALCAKRDSINASIEPLRKQLDETTAAEQVLRNKAMDLAAQIQDARGGAEWLALKKEIGFLAAALSGKR